MLIVYSLMFNLLNLYLLFFHMHIADFCLHRLLTHAVIFVR